MSALNEPKRNSRFGLAELLGCLLIVTSVWMFLVGHKHNAQLFPDPSFINALQHPQRRHPSYTDGEVYDGIAISNMILGLEPLPNDHKLKFRPGTLTISSEETLQHCYVDMSTYKKHFDKLLSVQVSVSNKHKLIYRNVPKSASSSSRKIMQDFFDGKDTRIKHEQLNLDVLEHNYTLVSFVREPLDRFYSSYDEAFLRMGPWWGSGSFAEEKPAIHKSYMSNKHKIDPYSYLYEGMGSINDFRKMYCPSELLEQKNGYIKCTEVNTIDDGSLTRRFEHFVNDYDGTDPFDSHLRLQVSFLVYNSRSNGAPLPVRSIYNASNAHAGWRDIAIEKGVVLPNDGTTLGRKNSRKFNLSLVSNATKQKICQIVALDYCCLNLQLPDVCKTEDVRDGVFCTLEQKNVKDQRGKAYDALVIQAYRNYIQQNFDLNESPQQRTNNA